MKQTNNGKRILKIIGKHLMGDESVAKLSDALVSKTKSIVNSASNEEDLKIGFEKILDPLRASLGINYSPKYNKTIYNVGGVGFSDVLHVKL